MRDFFRQYQALGLILLMFTWPLYTLCSTPSTSSPRAWLPRNTSRALSFLQSQTDGSLGSVSDFWNKYIDLVDVQSENERLRLDNARLREENIRLQGVLQENIRLTRLVGFRESNPNFSLVPARVIAADTSPFFRTLRVRLELDPNDPQKVLVGMPVINAEGVVGQVESVSKRYCDVLLAIDPRSSIDILTQSNRARGVLRGLGHDRDYLAELAYLLRRDQAEVGDLIVTSGRGGRFPRELLVGRIVHLDKQEVGLYQSAIIEPAVDFSRLDEVFIITNTLNPDADLSSPPPSPSQKR
jgi:rod shape-determining protein MreC